MNMDRSAAIALVFLCAARVAAQDDHTHGQHAHGQVEFPVSCATDVQPAFNDAVALLHSFEYEEARRAFLAIAERDDSCGMAYWGVAMTYYHPLWAPPMPEEFAAGRAAAEKAARLGARTDRDKAYIAAINAFYDDPERNHGQRAVAYRDAMEQAATRFADDDEATIFYALAILGTAPPSDVTYASQKRAAEILNRLLPEHPQHPGIAHYTIHAFDAPELAELALPAARVYAQIAPESPHALHMPTHIFTRRGLWDETIAGNLRCADVGQAQVARTRPGATATEVMHCGDYLAYAYLQRGEDQKARQVLEQVTAARSFNDPNFAAGYALLAVPARFALERRDWQAASDLTRPNVQLAWAEFAYADGVLHFANAIGAASLRDFGRAKSAITELERLQAALAAKPPAGPYDWAGQVEATRLSAAGWLAFAEGRSEDAVRLLTQAAEKEETVGKHPVTPGAILPARELLGDVLLELDRPQDALAAYERALADSPRRFHSLLGAARAARAAENTDKASHYYSALVELAGASTTRKAELTEAEEFVASAGTARGRDNAELERQRLTDWGVRLGREALAERQYGSTAV